MASTMVCITSKGVGPDRNMMTLLSARRERITKRTTSFNWGQDLDRPPFLPSFLPSFELFAAPPGRSVAENQTSRESEDEGGVREGMRRSGGGTNLSDEMIERGHALDVSHDVEAKDRIARVERPKHRDRERGGGCCGRLDAD